MQEHLTEQLAIAGMPRQHIEEPTLRLLARYVHESRLALGPSGYAMVYRALGWAQQHGRIEL